MLHGYFKLLMSLSDVWDFDNCCIHHAVSQLYPQNFSIKILLGYVLIIFRSIHFLIIQKIGYLWDSCGIIH